MIEEFFTSNAKLYRRTTLFSLNQILELSIFYIKDSEFTNFTEALHALELPTFEEYIRQNIAHFFLESLGADQVQYKNFLKDSYKRYISLELAKKSFKEKLLFLKILDLTEELQPVEEVPNDRTTSA